MGFLYELVKSLTPKKAESHFSVTIYNRDTPPPPPAPPPAPPPPERFFCLFLEKKDIKFEILLFNF